MHHDPDFVALCDDAKTRIQEMSLEELLDRQSRGEEILLIDVREDREWEADRMPGSVHIGKGVLERDLASHTRDKGQALVLYCGGGFRSALAADVIQRMGYERVWSLIGGIKAWRAHERG